MNLFKPLGKAILISIPMYLLSCKSIKSNFNFEIRGSFNGVDTGTIKMMSIDGDSLLYFAAIKNGKFNIKGYIQSPQLLLFNISPYSWNFRAFVEKGNLTLIVDTSNAKHIGNRKNPGEGWALIWEVEQKGSVLANIYKQYKIETNTNNFISETNLWLEKLKMEKVSNQDSQFIKERIDSLKIVYEKKRRNWIDSFINVQPGSIAGTFILNEYYVSQSNRNLDDILSMIGKFESPATTSIYFHEIKTLANDLQALQVNSIAPNFTLQTPDSTDFSLSDISGKVILLDFWASWCAPCRKAIPNWKEIYTKHKNNGFTIVGISNDRKWGDWIKALNQENMEWIQVIDYFPNNHQGSIISEKYKTTLLPYYVLIGSDNRIILATNSEESMRNKIEEIFN
jgi:thiol-disulfide isomerase/thioredoxin